MMKQTKKPGRTRLTLASLYLAVGLAVCFVVLTRMVPAMNTIVDDKARGRQDESGGWSEIVLRLSAWTCAHQPAAIVLFGLIAAGGFIFPWFIRPARYLVWAIALGVFLFDVALAGGGYWNMIGGVLKEANNLNR